MNILFVVLTSAAFWGVVYAVLDLRKKRTQERALRERGDYEAYLRHRRARRRR
ncbi:MAG: hypothetical protein AAF624_02305 [Bacteroidota bacterium]